jgi:hypothetical protein
MGKAAKEARTHNKGPGPANYDTDSLTSLKGTKSRTTIFGTSRKSIEPERGHDYYNIPAAYPNAPSHAAKDWFNK